MDALQPHSVAERMDADALTSARRSATHQHLRRHRNEPYPDSLLTLGSRACRLAELPAPLSI
jgi:hypothetical protein